LFVLEIILAIYLLRRKKIGGNIINGTIYVCSDYICIGLPAVVTSAENPQGISNNPVRNGAHLMLFIRSIRVVPSKRLPLQGAFSFGFNYFLDTIAV
jgi:hypothetical protein